MQMLNALLWSLKPTLRRVGTNTTLLLCSRTTPHHNLLHFIVIHSDCRSLIFIPMWVHALFATLQLHLC